MYNIPLFFFVFFYACGGLFYARSTNVKIGTEFLSENVWKTPVKPLRSTGNIFSELVPQEQNVVRITWSSRDNRFIIFDGWLEISDEFRTLQLGSIRPRDNRRPRLNYSKWPPLTPPGLCRES